MNYYSKANDGSNDNNNNANSPDFQNTRNAQGTTGTNDYSFLPQKYVSINDDSTFLMHSPENAVDRDENGNRIGGKKNK